jgi:hypothetical protein
MPLEYLGIDFTTRRELTRDPSWDAAATAIDLLGGEDVRLVRLSTRAGTSLSIGGGTDGRYDVRGVRCTGVGTSLLDPANGGAEVPKAVVLRVAALFYRDGRFDATLSWGAARMPVAAGVGDA